MTTTVFTNGVTLSDADWCNDVDAVTYDGATTQILVGGGAGSVAVWTTATGTGSPVRAGSPTFSGTPIFGGAASAQFGTTHKWYTFNDATYAYLTNAASGDQEGLRVSTTEVALLVAGTAVLTGTATALATIDSFQATGGFGCNTKAPQSAYASGGALNTYGAGANGLDTGANMSALHAMVVAIRAALVANGIMS